MGQSRDNRIDCHISSVQVGGIQIIQYEKKFNMTHPPSKNQQTQTLMSCRSETDKAVLSQLNAREGTEGYPYHVDCAEHVAVVVAGLQVLGDIGKRAQVLWVLGCTRDIPNLVLCNDVLHREERQHRTH